MAEELIETARIRHGLFFAHLALEKMLKAHVCRETGQLAPKIHNLVRLADFSKLSVSNEHWAVLGRFNQYQLEGRYPDKLPTSPSKEKAKQVLKEGEEMLAWLKKQF